jgi:hypothetical protein
MAIAARGRIMNAPVPLPSRNETIHDRVWWAAECEHLGTDWQSLGQVVARLVMQLAPCPTCGATPCVNPSFCETCRQERTSTMADKFDDTNRGVLFNERDRKQTEKDRDYSGKINIGGREFWLSAWIKTSKKGLKFLSLSAKAMDSPAAKADIDINDENPF